MRRFTIQPLSPFTEPVDVVGPDEQCVFFRITKDCPDAADVWEQGNYLFSVALNPEGFWCIFGRPFARDGDNGK